jgi:hypothetical protein
MSMQRYMQPVVVAGLALFVTVQALTGFATDGENVVPDLKRKAHVASERMGTLIADPAGEAPRDNATHSRALSHDTVYIDGASVRLPITVEARCRQVARRLLATHLNGASELRVEKGEADRYGRVQGRVYDERGTDIAQAVQSQTPGRCARVL